jgi:hypothetical protein
MADPCVGGRSGAPFLRQSLCSDPTSPARDLLAPSRPASTGARCTDSASQFPIAPAESGAPLPATSFPGGFRTPALSVCGCHRHRAGVRNPSHLRRSRLLQLASARVQLTDNVVHRAEWRCVPRGDIRDNLSGIPGHGAANSNDPRDTRLRRSVKLCAPAAAIAADRADLRRQGQPAADGSGPVASARGELGQYRVSGRHLGAVGVERFRLIRGRAHAGLHGRAEGVTNDRSKRKKWDVRFRTSHYAANSREDKTVWQVAK